MRGYEATPCRADGLGLSRYESPCGVMSSGQTKSINDLIPLRIPMRGYEAAYNLVPAIFYGVTNPHAGL